MYTTLQSLHSYWAYLVFIILAIATINALYKFLANKEFTAFDFRISLFTLIVSHIQLIIGIVLFFVADYISIISESGMSSLMKNADLRDKIIEHPLTMIIAIVLITIGYSKHKKKLTSKPKFKMVAVFYTLAFILVLAKIPWKTWLA